MTLKRFTFKNLCAFAGKFIYTNWNSASKYDTLCRINIEHFLKRVILTSILMFVSYMMMGAGATYVTLFTNDRINPMSLLLPAFDEDSDIAFYINYGIQTIIAGLAVMGNISVEIASCIINDTIQIIPKTIHIDVDEMAIKLETGENYLKTKARLHNILMKVQDFDR